MNGARLEWLDKAASYPDGLCGENQSLSPSSIFSTVSLYPNTPMTASNVSSFGQVPERHNHIIFFVTPAFPASDAALRLPVTAGLPLLVSFLRAASSTRLRSHSSNSHFMSRWWPFFTSTVEGRFPLCRPHVLPAILLPHRSCSWPPTPWLCQ